MIGDKEKISSQISPWTAEFYDPAKEAAYREQNAGPNIKHTRVGLALWAVLLIVFIYSDYINLGTAYGFWLLLAMRVGVSIVILVFGIIIGRYPSLVMAGYGIAFLLILGWTGFFMNYFLLPAEAYPWIIAMTMAMLIGQYVFIPNRVTTGTAAALYAIAGAIVSVGWVADTELPELTALGLMFLAPAATGLFVAHRFQTSHRNAFARLLEAETANARLEREIQARKELEAELKRQADTDSLTGLNNRRRYEALFRQEFKRSRRYRSRLSLFVLDLDNFKQINDNYGHSAGDIALQKLADLCRSSLREADIIGRLGGEEFVVLLPDTGGSDAYNVADRLREKISEMEIETDHGRFTLTATIGVAETSPDDKDIEDLVRRADTALYKGKAAGKNRVSLLDSSAD